MDNANLPSFPRWPAQVSREKKKKKTLQFQILHGRQPCEPKPLLGRPAPPRGGGQTNDNGHMGIPDRSTPVRVLTLPSLGFPDS